MDIIPHTERRELPPLGDIPIGELAKHCQDPAVLTTIISLTYNLGYKRGLEQAHRQYNIMFKGERQTAGINN